MKKFIIIFTLLICSLNLNAKESNVVMQKDFEDKVVTVDLDGYKILQFSKSIMKIQFDSSEYIDADFLKDSTDLPLSTLKVKGKKIGKQNAIVTFYDDSIVSVKFNIVKNINDVIHLVSELFPNIKVSQINDTVVLQGYVKNKTQRSKILDIFEKYGIKKDEKIIDLIRDDYSTKMVRVKLYVVQIDNDNSEQFINDWSLLNFSDGTTEVSNVDFTSNITSLTGGITAAAARLGSKFDIELNLNYLKKNDAVKIVNESTLIMKEQQESVFTAGGSFKVSTSTTADNGTTSTGYEDVEYGLNITITIDKIIEDNYIDFSAEAESSEIDWDNAVDGIPGLTGNKITTNVLVEHGSTIVLAGILKSDLTKYEEKIPLLGDIPLLGKLFTSRQSNDTNTDLVFFITPEIIDPMKNNQEDLLNKKLNIVKNKEYDDKAKDLNTKIDEKKVVEPILETKTKELTDEEKHQKRVNEIFGL